jgi:hypothetical protein
MYLIVITDAKADFPDLTLEKHHDLTRDRMWQKMKNVSATEPVPLTIDGHPALQDELSGTENGTNVVFLHTTVDDGDHFQPRMLSGDPEVALAKAERTIARNYPDFSQREIESFRLESALERDVARTPALCWSKCWVLQLHLHSNTVTVFT